MNILCKLGLHYPIKPLKHRRVGHLRDTQLCKWCHSIDSLGGWYYREGLEDYFNEEATRKLEKSFAFSLIPSSWPFAQQVRMVKSLGHDTTEEDEELKKIEFYFVQGGTHAGDNSPRD